MSKEKELTKIKPSSEDVTALVSNSWINRFIKIFEKQGYVHISNEDLSFNSLLEKKYRAYNRYKEKAEQIQTSKSNSEIRRQVERLKKLGGDKILDEILALLDLTDFFKDKGIRDNSYINKRNCLFYVFKNTLSTKNCLILSQHPAIFYDSKTVNLIHIKNVNDYLKKIADVLLLDEAKNSDIYYRGQQNINWVCKPSIFRKTEWIEHENELLQELILRCPEDFEKEKTYIEKLAKAQHYGLPTRLLDFTTSPLIALYFACEQIENSDSEYYGEVLVVKANKNIPKKNMIEFSAKDSEADISKAVFIFTKHTNKRITNQQGLFLLVGKGRNETSPADYSEIFLKSNDTKKIIFIISDKNKRSILKELESLGINKAFIYPEIQDVATYLKKDWI